MLAPETKSHRCKYYKNTSTLILICNIRLVPVVHHTIHHYRFNTFIWVHFFRNKLCFYLLYVQTKKKISAYNFIKGMMKCNKLQICRNIMSHYVINKFKKCVTFLKIKTIIMTNHPTSVQYTTHKLNGLSKINLRQIHIIVSSFVARNNNQEGTNSRKTSAVLGGHFKKTKMEKALPMK